MSQSYDSPKSRPTAAPSTSTSQRDAVTTPLASSQAQSSSDYFHQTHALNTPSGWKGARHTLDDVEREERRKEMEEHAKRFAHSRDSLVGSIGQTSAVLSSLRDFNKQRWIVHYPAIDRQASTRQQPRRSIRRAQSVAPGDHIEEHESHDDARSGHAETHPGIHRSNTEAVVAQSAPNTPIKQQQHMHAVDDEDEQDDHAADDAEANSQMSVLRLDLKLGAAGHNPQALVRTLEKSSVAQLLDERMISSIRQLDSLRDRISDTQSKVLVTGDLNAGKSTFVNALMRRKLMPVDQQPCTTVFCEVLDAEHANEGREEVHLVHAGMTYDVQNDNTYTRHEVQDIEKIVADAEDLSPEDAPMLKCYCHDTRSTQESLLRNGIVDIALIDAPGLNRDSLKTTALFARQEQIDVVVFVVSAENHFTLSAKEFLWNASNDKAYIFIVVNKFDQIHNKDKCKRLVLEQIKQLSPRTYDDADELVHFVDSDAVGAAPASPSGPDTPTEDRKVAGEDPVVLKAPTASPAASFTQLEACLRDFVLQRRERSKLLPAQTYLLRLLSDIEFLASTNHGVASAELAEARRQLELARPALAECQAAHSKMEARLEGEEDGVVSAVSQRAHQDLDEAVDLIGKGKLASSKVSLPPYPGLFSVVDFAADVREAFYRSLDISVSEAEQAAKDATQQTVSRIKEIGESYLPNDVERSQRVFLPDAMFSKRLRRRNAGPAGLGLRPDFLQTRLTDIFDVPHFLSIVTRAYHGKEGKGDDKALSKHIEEDIGMFSGVSLGLGAMTYLGTKAYGAKSALDAAVHFSNLAGNATVRQWTPRVIAIASTLLAIYVIHDLPNSIPRNIGRNMKRDLQAPSSSSTGTDDSTTITVETSVVLKQLPQTISFTEYHSDRLAKEVRKVIRLAGWDLQERFRVALADRKRAVETFEGQEDKSQTAITWFEQTSAKVALLRDDVRAVKIA